MSVEIDLRAALYTRLAAQIVGVGKDCTAVYETPPETAVPPYVDFGEIILTSEDAQTRNRFSALIRLHTWDRSSSKRRVLNIQGDIYAALHDYDLPTPDDGGGAANWVCYSLLHETSRVDRDPDGVMHGISEYRALIHSA